MNAMFFLVLASLVCIDCARPLQSWFKLSPSRAFTENHQILKKLSRPASSARPLLQWRKSHRCPERAMAEAESRSATTDLGIPNALKMLAQTLLAVNSASGYNPSCQIMNLFERDPFCHRVTMKRASDELMSLDQATNRVYRIAVGSKNPVKLASGAQGFEKIVNNFDAASKGIVRAFAYSVPSGVPEQPIGDEETLTGAKNRALACWNEFATENGESPDFGVGMEGGISDDAGIMTCYAYISIFNGVRYGVAKTATFEIPKKIANLVRNGMELGDASDAVFDELNIKQRLGTVGQLTKGLINRTEYYVPAVVLAYAPFNYPELYEE